ncbi:MAG: hypothetical protein C0501_15695 [Isosphaera sp.]|nr:hypothetical protein [Isosphaera sp.]
MRLSFALVLLLPGAAAAQLDAGQKKATADWVVGLMHPQGGFYAAAKDPRTKVDPLPGLRATSAAVRALKYLGAEVPNKDKHAAFVLGCFDPKTGGFAEPGGKPDVTLTSVGVMGAVELGVPKEKFAKAMDYLKEHAKTFEDVRIGAAAVEAWGVKDCPFDLKPWLAVADKERQSWTLPPAPWVNSGLPRGVGSYQAFRLRLGYPPGVDARKDPWLGDTQWSDGGWGRDGAKASDLETTYRVMRALMLLKEKPKDVGKPRTFLAAHRNKDGGYGAKPGDVSAAGPTYYAVIISKWLDEMEKK